MIPPFGICSGSESGTDALRRYQERKLRMMSFWRDGIERQLAALNAAITTLEQQMHRDQADHQG
ncbi:sigma factor SigF [Cyanobium gracile]|uniref:Sigma factor SigF n=1 Tax=Cyanobium gracile UHCC 0281 TaxID=3110309 RepID=A0ABU5SRB6_9CYAN|nr:sigma factor SigF [Cyanobium gracile]MEA5441054.1 sigma factor SigF [Cyanobium gracile UHCC 0281]